MPSWGVNWSSRRGSLPTPPAPAGSCSPSFGGLALTFGSEPGDTARKIGAFLIQVEYQATVITTAMFMTSAAANAFIAELAFKTANTYISWGTWALAAIVPGVLSLIVMTYLLYKIYPPEIKETPEAAEMAHRELEKMGPMKRDEKILLFVFFLILALWITGQWTKIDATIVALLGVSIMLITGVIKWDEVLAEKGSWDALIWFGGLVMMAGGLNTLGLMKWFAGTVGASVTGYSWLPALAILLLVFFYVHYAFASLTAHITAMYAPFLLVAVSTGAPPYLAALTLAFSCLLCASLTHYGTGASPIYFNAGYMTQKTWWVLGFIASVVNIVIWVGVGGLWWKVLGLW